VETIELLEAATKSGFLALVLTLAALGYQTRELRRIRDQHQEDEDECRKRIGRLTRAVTDMHLWARSHGGGRRRQKLPDLSDLIDPREPDDDPPSDTRTH